MSVIGHSPGKMLQACIFAYPDAHRYRLGTHYESLPVNAPRYPVAHYYLDGAMRADVPRYGDNDNAYYEPSPFGGSIQDSVVKEPQLQIEGNADRYDHREGNDDYREAGGLFRLLDEHQRARLASNIAEAMGDVPKAIIERQLTLFARADERYAEAVRAVVEEF